MKESQNQKAKYAHILKNPRITEKANFITANNVHTFNIDESATKKDVKEAIKAFYKVVPTKISIARTPRKAVFIRGKRGKKSGVKKAYVFLKEGDKIE